MENEDSSHKNPVKRRKLFLDPETLTQMEKESKLSDLAKELKCLFQYYKEVLLEKEQLNETDADSSLVQSLFACLLEERSLSHSKLVAEIYQKLKDKEGITKAYVATSVLDVGHRKTYGILNDDVGQVLEDENEDSLWCWETKNLKLIPEIHQIDLKSRRYCRSKIHQRIEAVTGMIAALERSLSDPNQNIDSNKELNNLLKAPTEADIRLLFKRMAEKCKTEMEANFKVKDLKKELETKTREAEKEKKQNEKKMMEGERELKRFQEDTEKEARRRDKLEVQMKKKLKSQQEEAEKKSRRWEKELVEVRRQLSYMKQEMALQKQVSRMERLSKAKKSGSSAAVGPSSPDMITLASSMGTDGTPTTEIYSDEGGTPVASPIYFSSDDAAAA